MNELIKSIFRFWISGNSCLNQFLSAFADTTLRDYDVHDWDTKPHLKHYSGVDTTKNYNRKGEDGET